MKMVSNQQIAAAIRQMRSRYISESKASSYWEINNGLCDDFARDVAEFLGGETDDLYSVENGNFQVDGDTISGEWDWGLLEKHWGIKPCMGLKKNQACAIDFGSHVWLTDGKLHYDAECPDGVTSFFELPIFRRCVVLELRNNGVACDDVVTDDVLPSPHCPVPNPEPSIKHPRMQAQGTRKMEKLYHGTSTSNIPGILRDGLNGPSCWGSKEVASYFAARECTEVGGHPALISIALDELDQSALKVDTQMLDFPVLTDIAGADHGMLQAEWEQSEMTWRDCVNIYESVVFTKSVAVTESMLIDYQSPARTSRPRFG